MTKQAVILNHKREHCSTWTNVEAIVYMLKKREPNSAISTTVVAGCIQELITEFPAIQGLAGMTLTIFVHVCKTAPPFVHRGVVYSMW